MNNIQLKILNKTIRKKLKKVDFDVISEQSGIKKSRIYLWKSEKLDLNEEEILNLVDKFSGDPRD